MKNNLMWIKLPLAAALLLGVSSSIVPQQAKVFAETYNADVEVKLAPLKIQIGNQLLDVPGGKSLEGDTYVGLAFLSQQLGLKTAWDAATSTVSVSSPNKTMSMHNQNTQFTLNEHTFYSALPPVIIDGTTYLPLRFLLEQMGYKIGYNDATHVITIQKIQENELKLVNKSIERPISDNRSITLQYPQIEGWKDAAATAKINAFIQAEIASYEAAAQKQLKEVTGDIGKDESNFPYTFDVNYEVTYNQDNQLSFYFNVYTFSGGAHGMYNWDAHTFDLTTGAELTLQQVAQKNPNYKTIINDEIKKQLKEKDYELFEPFQSIRDDQGFYLKDDTVVVYFSLYEYAPYVMGILEFPIPIAKFTTK